MKVKICGNTSLEDARVATEAGADMLGFIFYKHSPRDISPEKAGEIIRALRAEFGRAAPLMVGIFVDELMGRVREIRQQAGLDLVQLHGSEPPVELRLLQPFAFKAIRPQNRGDAEGLVAIYAQALPNNPDAPDFLLDAYHPWKMGGTGHKGDWHSAKVLATRYKLMLAGGLNVENVVQAIRTTQPWGVDVVSGVEASKGVKDHERVKRFIREAKGASANGRVGE
jgi:phosphoribosylanthranilate isomerase